MTEPRWEDEEQVLADLGAALRAPGAVSEELVEAGRQAATWRTVDEELAALAYDSALDADLLVRARSAGTVRTLVFDGDGLSVQVEVAGGELVGQLTPPQTGQVTLSTPAGSYDQTSADEIGCFLLGQPRGPVRLRCQTEQAVLVTDWVCL